MNLFIDYLLHRFGHIMIYTQAVQDNVCLTDW